MDITCDKYMKLTDEELKFAKNLVHCNSLIRDLIDEIKRVNEDSSTGELSY